MREFFTLVEHGSNNATILAHSEAVEKREYCDEEAEKFLNQTLQWKLIKYIEEDHDHEDFGEATSEETKTESIEMEQILVQDSNAVGCVVENTALLFSDPTRKAVIEPYEYSVSRIHSVRVSGYYSLQHYPEEKTNWKWDPDTSTLTICGAIDMLPEYYRNLVKKVVVEPDVELDDVKIISSLKNLEVAEILGNITKIRSGLFCGCGKLKTVKLPDTVAWVGSNAFDGCYKLENIRLHNVTAIDERAFYCSSLESIDIPNVTKIGDHAFDGCRSLKRVSGYGKKTDPSGVAKIGQFAFSRCRSLTDITIPDGVTRIEKHTFSECRSLTNITIPGSVTGIGQNAFSECTGLTNVTLSPGLSKISNNAFSGCTSLSSINFPDGMIEIESWAFNGCACLTSIDFPDSLHKIGFSAFAGCVGLRSVTIRGRDTEIGKDAFKGSGTYHDPLVIIAPAGSKAEEYAREHYWVKFRTLE